jgi:HD-GYP domain-containing protein (c-di-GMP phosphodiesterase class II)
MLHLSDLGVEGNIERLLMRLIALAESKDCFALGHSGRVAQYAYRVASELVISETQLQWIGVGAFLHDVGKFEMPEGILDKPGKLDPGEWEIVHHHPQYGYNLLNGLQILPQSLQIVLQHHELLDGSGYPFQLSGSEISLGARIVTVADIFDAMTTQRSYRQALCPKEVMDYIRDRAKQGVLDSEVVDVFADTIIREGATPPALSEAAA